MNGQDGGNYCGFWGTGALGASGCKVLGVAVLKV